MQRMIVGGIVQFGRYTFSISPLADETDRHVIRLLDHRNIRCSTRSVQAKALKVKTIGKTGAAPAALGPIQIDVAFFFTSFTSSDAGGDDKATLAIEVAICNLNISLEESLPSPLKKVQIHPVCIQRIDDGEEHPDCSLENLAMLEDPADGEWDDVHAVRKQKAADLVCLITYHGGSAANVMTTPSISFRDKAFSVVQLSELPMNVLAHEIGHNLGCCHQKGAAAGTSCLGHTVSTAKCLTHAHAFVNPTSNDASIVAAGGNRLPFFSNPNVTPGGQPLGDTATAYNAKVISDNATLVSSFY